MPLILWLIIIAECGIWNHHMLFGSFRSLNDHESLKSPNEVVDDIKKWARKLDPEEGKQLASKLDELSTVLSNGDDFISFIHSFDELFASSVAIIILFLVVVGVFILLLVIIPVLWFNDQNSKRLMRQERKNERNERRRMKREARLKAVQNCMNRDISISNSTSTTKSKTGQTNEISTSATPSTNIVQTSLNRPSAS
ncbi:hypothetical protein BLOT_008623 [Blomia tropicalis]|nr:hypothetical protein BLOT_008623 [Blomia tropicalis]